MPWAGSQELKVVDITWGVNAQGKMGFEEIPGSERIIPCELALLAIGFTGAEKGGMVDELKLELDERGNIKIPKLQNNTGRNFRCRRYSSRSITWSSGLFQKAVKPPGLSTPG